jgi:hypothetical protein
VWHSELTTKAVSVHEVLDHGAQDVDRDDARSAPQLLDRDAHFYARGVAHILDRGVKADACGAAQVYLIVLLRPTPAAARRY